MRPLSVLITATFCLLLILSACRGKEPKRIPDTLPEVRGYISHIKRTTENGEKSKAIILVKAIDGVEVRYPEANVVLDKNTLIESKSGEYLKLEHLREGQEIEAWFEGEVKDSIPVQGYVKAIRVQTQ